jgi:uncharacterized protein
MAVDHIRYDLLAQEALRGVVRKVLGDVARNGLPGEHHFYISFDTQAEGVRLSARMLAQYPKEMTVVLQHQFWDLIVGEDGFEVGLSFGGVPERLAIAFAAITGFFDPSVQFGLRFEEASPAGSEEGERKAEPASPSADRGKRQARETRSRAPATKLVVPAAANPPPVLPDSPASETPPPAASGEKPDGGAEVVRLDRFRKK